MLIYSFQGEGQVAASGPSYDHKIGTMPSGPLWIDPHKALTTYQLVLNMQYLMLYFQHLNIENILFELYCVSELPAFMMECSTFLILHLSCFHGFKEGFPQWNNDDNG